VKIAQLYNSTTAFRRSKTNLLMCSKPRLIRIRFDRRFYPVEAKIQIKRRCFFLASRHFDTAISARIV